MNRMTIALDHEDDLVLWIQFPKLMHATLFQPTVAYLGQDEKDLANPSGRNADPPGQFVYPTQADYSTFHPEYWNV